MKVLVDVKDGDFNCGFCEEPVERVISGIPFSKKRPCSGCILPEILELLKKER